MATSGDPAFEAFLEDARQRAAAEPIPDRVLNEIKILLLIQRREMRTGDSLRSMEFDLIGLEWRTRWAVPKILEALAQESLGFQPYGQAVARAMQLIAASLNSGAWSLADAASLLRAPIETVHEFGDDRHATAGVQRLSRSGIRGADEIRKTAATIIDLAALGLEVAVVAWARVLGVQDAWIELVASGRSQAEAHTSVIEAGLPMPLEFERLADTPVTSPLPSEWLSATHDR